MYKIKSSIAVVLISFLAIMVCHADEVELKIGGVGASVMKGEASGVPFATGFGGILAPGQDIEDFVGYVSFGDAMIRKKIKVVNVGEAGSATFDYDQCVVGLGCISFRGYGTQLNDLIAKVGIDTNLDFIPDVLNLDGVVTTFTSDCMQSLIGGQPEPCTLEEMDDVADRVVAHGNAICAWTNTKGNQVLAIFDEYMPYDQIDWSVFAAFGATWVISESDWNILKDKVTTRVAAEVSCAVHRDFWGEVQDGKYATIPDNLHGDLDSMKRAVIELEQIPFPQ